MGYEIGLNKDYIGRVFGPETYFVDTHDLRAYSSAIGNKNSSYPISPCFSASYELPLIYVILKDPNLHGSEEQMNENMLMLVHGDHSIRLYKTLSSVHKIHFTALISEIQDKGCGEYIKFKVLSRDADGNRLVESEWGLFIRGIGSGIKTKTVFDPRKSSDELGDVIFQYNLNVPEDITKRYSEASNDMNPIHLNDDVAKKAGLPGIVVHGMCTMAMSVQTILDKISGDGTYNLKSVSGRFSALVFPGEELLIEVWKTELEDGVQFQVLRKSDRIKVLKGGLIKFAI